MKTGIFYDTLIQKGGAQRVTIELANKLNANIITSGFNSSLRKWIDIKTKIIDIRNKSIKWNYMIEYNIMAPFRFFLNRKKFNYDIYIFTGNSSIFGSVNRNKNKNILYVHTPNRILYDLRERKLDDSGWIKRLFYKIYIGIFYPMDQRIIKNNFKKIICNSKNVQKRVRKYYHMKSIVIYPPINIKKFKFNRFGDFYLAVSRLIPEKRLDLIAKVFTNIPNKKLIIVGNGSEKKNILDIIKGSKNIQLLDNVDDKTLINLYSNCLATIYMPVDEDFGLVPLEGMASGKPCIAVNEGGCKETVINNKTGFLIEANEKELIKIINNFNVKIAEKMKGYCINQAKRFDIKNFTYKWNKLLVEYNKKRSKKYVIKKT